jgi:heat-inducible transcriptional repressor
MPPMTPPLPELTTRMRDIFGLVVEAYLERGQPIGSKSLTRAVNLSPRRSVRCWRNSKSAGC